MMDDLSSIHGARCFMLRSPEATVSVTEVAGHMAPVQFHFPRSCDFQPYSLPPWLPNEHDVSSDEHDVPPLLRYLRGDFLCLPFGGQPNGPPHGDVANCKWQLHKSNTSSTPSSLPLSSYISSSENYHLRIVQDSNDTGARVTKTLSLINGHHAVYIENVIENLEGKWSYGTHPILDFSLVDEGAARIATSPFIWASVYGPNDFADASKGEAGALRAGENFRDLSRVPCKISCCKDVEASEAGSFADLTRYPARRGFEDLVMLVSAPSTAAQPFAWTAVTFPSGHVWLSLKNTEDFPSTLFWLSNGGRTMPPWEGRHTARLGLEEVCSHFHDGLVVSREDRLASQSIPTCKQFNRSVKTRLPVIHAAAEVPADFGLVKRISPAGVGRDLIEIEGENGHSVTIPIDWRFLFS